MSPPCSLHELIIEALDAPQSSWSETDGSKDAIAKQAIDSIQQYAVMLEDYFGLGIDEKGRIYKVPLIGPASYAPSMVRLPELVLDLGTTVDWKTEEHCLTDIAVALARWCSYMDENPEDSTINGTPHSRTWLLEHAISPELKHPSFCPSRSLLLEQKIWELASVENLYKIFERC